MLKTIFLTTSLAVLALAAVAPSTALAANAKRPYANVNHANDKGNPTGDSETDKLNQQQLDQARAGK